MINSIKIISGGQSGVDRAALDFALENSIVCGGFCPKGRLAEDGPIDPKYPLIESLSPEFHKRTELNLLLTDGTLILTSGKMDTGTIFTHKLVEKYEIPNLVVNLKIKKDPTSILNWILDNNISMLNIAGPRESSSPGIYKKAKGFMESFFMRVLQQK